MSRTEQKRKSMETLKSIGVKEIGGRRMLGIRRQGPFSEMGSTFRRVSKIAKEKGILDRDEAFLCHAVLCNVSNCDPREYVSAVAVLVPEEVSKPDEFEEFRVPEGFYLTATMHGPYSKLPDAWLALTSKWAPSKNLQLIECCAENPSFEIYRKFDDDTGNITELCAPIASAVSQSVRMSRTFNCAPETLFGIWKDDETRSKLGYPDQVYEKPLTFEVGVVAKSHMKNAAGERFIDFEEQFLAIEENRRIVFLIKTMIRGKVTTISTNTIEFLPVGDDKSEMVILETPTWFDGKSHVDSHRKGYESFFEEHETILKNSN